jgi:hypothetical protein
VEVALSLGQLGENDHHVSVFGEATDQAVGLGQTGAALEEDPDAVFCRVDSEAPETLSQPEVLFDVVSRDS